MIDIQDHIRNRGALNLFDGKGVKPKADQVTSPFARLTATIIDPTKPERGKAKPNTFTERQTITKTLDCPWVALPMVPSTTKLADVLIEADKPVRLVDVRLEPVGALAHRIAINTEAD